jgi:hypothetical protein
MGRDADRGDLAVEAQPFVLVGETQHGSNS